MKFLLQSAVATLMSGTVLGLVPDRQECNGCTTQPNRQVCNGCTARPSLLGVRRVHTQPRPSGP